MNENDIPNKIKSCTSLDVYANQEFPMVLCICCCQKLNELWSFRNMCLESDKTLRETLAYNSLYQHDQINERKTQNDEIERDSINNENSEDESEFLSEENFNFKIPIPENLYRCDICKNEFDQIFEYLDHQFEHNGNPVFKCDKCNVTLSTRQDLVNHDQNHKIACPKCGKEMKKSSLKLHLISHTDKFKCMQCSQTCNSRMALEQHKITVHTNIKAFICENCGKNFSSASSLRSHLLSHGTERKYACKLCEYAGRTASAIYIHMSKHAQDTCVCEVCSKVFKSNRNLNDHLRRVHSKIKKHVCPSCNRQFVDHYMLKVHLRIHTGLRPYKCNQCDKSFFRSDGLKEHMIVHKERVLYDCKSCHKQYMSNEVF
ncbi:hypothetical protein HHI36_021661 [Cryptolaemus montrouzieri]|uniref:Zinc finger protein n=1 Tax=Cryptolaemus montrouzieri TaxID=559131 RepID=A0ABD2MXJ2_9CUCU